MTVKEIIEKTEFGKSIKVVGIKDRNITFLGSFERYLEEYKKAFRKNAAYRYRETKAILDQEAVVVEDNYNKFNISYYIVTRRSFEGPFSKPLDEYQKIIFE